MATIIVATTSRRRFATPVFHLTTFEISLIFDLVEFYKKEREEDMNCDGKIMRLTESDFQNTKWINIFRERQIFFAHDGKKVRPHPFLLNGKHSNRFFDWIKLMENPGLLEKICVDLLGLVREGASCVETEFLPVPARVVTSGVHSITLAHGFAGTIRRNSAFTPKIAFSEPGCRTSEMGFFSFGRKMKAEETALVIEPEVGPDNILEIAETVNSIGRKGLKLFPIILTLFLSCHPSELFEMFLKKAFTYHPPEIVDKVRFISLIDTLAEEWPAEKCPLCKIGSTVLNPYTDTFWKKFTADY